MAQLRLHRAQVALEEGRRLIDAGELRRAAERLERARADFAAELSLDGVKQVRAEVERGYQGAAEADDPFYEQLLYASAQNVRFLSRREAARRGVAWVDPHPELDQPGRPEIRAERGIGRRAKAWIVGVSIVVVLALGGTAAGLALTVESATVVNDRSAVVQYGSCSSGSGTPDELAPGERKRFTGWSLCVAVLEPGTLQRRCLKLHDGETAKVSQARRCD